jgi:hypothetical protein
MTDIRVGDYAIIIKDIHDFPFAKGQLVEVAYIEDHSVYPHLCIHTFIVSSGVFSVYTCEELQVVTKKDNPEYFI